MMRRVMAARLKFERLGSARLKPAGPG
ncbi:hypothetical protein BJ956_001231 [Arthrobacter psychrochitiniphilus]|nr:hypothetical protein [Arthrobacter psychrochitiniphilus]